MLAAVGEALIDRIGGVERIGGCPFNVAKAASRLGASVTYFGKISSDRYGGMMLENMIDDGVMFDPALCNAPERTLCSHAKIDASGKAVYDFDYEGTAACTISKEELAESFSIVSDIDMVFIGSISLLMEPGCNAILPAIGTITPVPRLFLDPNVRPSLVKDPSAYRNMILELVSRSDVVKVSDEDLSYLIPEVDEEEAAQRLLKLCKMNLVVTHGENGSTWYTRSGKVTCHAVETETVVDTIGCGDTFDGAIIAYLQEHELVDKLDGLEEGSIRKMLEFASKAAAINCAREGCEPPSRDQL